jgi:hypothetical protein
MASSARSLEATIAASDVSLRAGGYVSR